MLYRLVLLLMFIIPLTCFAEGKQGEAAAAVEADEALPAEEQEAARYNRWEKKIEADLKAGRISEEEAEALREQIVNLKTLRDDLEADGVSQEEREQIRASERALQDNFVSLRRAHRQGVQDAKIDRRLERAIDDGKITEQDASDARASLGRIREIRSQLRDPAVSKEEKKNLRKEMNIAHGVMKNFDNKIKNGPATSRPDYMHGKVQEGLSNGQITREEAKELRGRIRNYIAHRKEARVDGITPEERGQLRQEAGDFHAAVTEKNQNDQVGTSASAGGADPFKARRNRRDAVKGQAQSENSATQDQEANDTTEQTRAERRAAKKEARKEAREERKAAKKVYQSAQ